MPPLPIMLLSLLPGVFTLKMIIILDSRCYQFVDLAVSSLCCSVITITFNPTNRKHSLL